MKHPLLIVMGIGLVAVLVVHRIAFREDGTAAGAAPVPAEEAPSAPGPGTEPPAAVPSEPVRAFDDFLFGVHLRYPEDWEGLAVDEVPPGPPGRILTAVSPPGSEATLVVQQIGPLVPRAGVEMIARRSAEMAEREIRGTEVIPFARGQALRVLASGGGRVEETRFFNHRQSLLAVRLIAPEDDPEALATLRARADSGLTFD